MEGDEEERPRALEVFVVSLAALLLEISFTRVISFKLFYYYTYLTIGLALLGLGAGGVVVATSARVRHATTDRLLATFLTVASVTSAVSYLVVARLPIASTEIWQYGTGRSYANIGLLVALCVALAVPFVVIGVLLSTIFARGSAAIGRLYFSDLLGAGLACAVVVWLIGTQGPPATISLAASLLAATAARTFVLRRSGASAPAAVATSMLAVVLLGAFVVPDRIPDVRTDDLKAPVGDTATSHSEWSPIFRVDAANLGDRTLLFHDGMLGSAIYRYDGDPTSLGRFDDDPRSFAFAANGTASPSVLIIGAAGGNEILASLYFGAGEIDAVELNDVTYALLNDRMADYAGNIAADPIVDYVRADGRSYLAQRDRDYDLVWYPAPDSYAAQNAATSGAFVLSESYLYTEETVQESLDHLSPGGLLVAQFGEVDFETKPNRTARYVSTVRSALSRRGGVAARQIAVITTPTDLGGSRVSTVLVKDSAFTVDELDRLDAQVAAMPSARVEYVPGRPARDSVVSRLVRARSDAAVEDVLSLWRYDVRPITDDGPFFWSFARLGDVVRDYGKPLRNDDLEDSAGERVLLLLLVLAVVLAAVALLLPFLRVRSVWSVLPLKGVSAVYFAAIGLGFLLYEITLIQQLVLFLGYPTYSLTVTLASILLFTGIGALVSDRWSWATAPVLFGILAVLTGGYLFGLPVLVDGLLSAPLAFRIAVTFVVLAPLGLCLGTFMPRGVRIVSALSPFDREYVAWAWAVNGFASVVASVLTTILAMTIGFRAVLVCALAVYAVALVALHALGNRSASTRGEIALETADQEPLVLVSGRGGG
jgi:hypothetical protein